MRQSLTSNAVTIGINDKLIANYLSYNRRRGEVFHVSYPYSFLTRRIFLAGVFAGSPLFGKMLSSRTQQSTRVLAMGMFDTTGANSSAASRKSDTLQKQHVRVL